MYNLSSLIEINMTEAIYFNILDDQALQFSQNLRDEYASLIASLPMYKIWFTKHSDILSHLKLIS